VSFPLFSDTERAEVGICYKQQGRDQAVELGFALAGPKFANFIAQAKQLAPQRQLRLHCWRGGMRSAAVAWVLQMAGFEVLLLTGGYKAFRRWAHQQFALPQPMLILGGMTGTGKTDILQALAGLGAQVIDLEGLASHRGSSFGALGLPPQPGNEQFENLLALAWAKLDPALPVWLEAESRRIGLCRIPDPIFAQMEQAQVIEISRTRSERLDYLVEIYGRADRSALIEATERIRKRLGGLRTQQAVDCTCCGVPRADHQKIRLTRHHVVRTIRIEKPARVYQRQRGDLVDQTARRRIPDEHIAVFVIRHDAAAITGKCDLIRIIRRPI
ncbi:MAG: tRNA 2-selenouridine(34) synthase MnmH, partial [Anaerolineae bacterium]|nr:tRNA 2-selenouridine(34) synthase MnmH [Anaerolineae bacterium]